MILTRLADMMFDQCHEASGLPQVRYNFVRLDQLSALDKDSIAGATIFYYFSVSCPTRGKDVIGIIKDVGALTEITTRSTNRLVGSLMHRFCSKLTKKLAPKARAYSR